MVAALLHDKEEFVRAAAAEACGKLDDVVTAAALEQATDQSSDIVRLYAVAAASERNQVGLLRRVSKSDAAPAVRAAAVIGLFRSGLEISAEVEKAIALLADEQQESQIIELIKEWFGVPVERERSAAASWRRACELAAR